MADMKQVARSAKSLIDNRDFGVVMDYMEQSLSLALTQGTPDDASENLRNLKAATALRQGTMSLANSLDDAEEDVE